MLEPGRFPIVLVGVAEGLDQDLFLLACPEELYRQDDGQHGRDPGHAEEEGKSQDHAGGEDVHRMANSRINPGRHKTAGLGGYGERIPKLEASGRDQAQANNN